MLIFLLFQNNIRNDKAERKGQERNVAVNNRDYGEEVFSVKILSKLREFTSNSDKSFGIYLVCRFQGEDFEGKMLQEAESIRHKLPLFVPPSSYTWPPGTGVRIVVVSCVITLSSYNSCLMAFLYV